MLDKLKLIYNLSPIVLVIITLFAGYIAYQYREDSIVATSKNDELSNKIEHLQQQTIKNNEVISKNATTKLELENESIKQQEQINALLSDNTCANTLVPVRITERLYDHANAIRQSTSTSQSN